MGFAPERCTHHSAYALVDASATGEEAAGYAGARAAKKVLAP
jgi:hypothetical protein